ncbi:Predicted arabinose efflux permease, MFS family [Roseivivax lentus]|uniref:Predicted arabinose efflux permease, MFS family n=1 Tax=Roseivivax lentus TaxID=633194 RepID=A0A1N7PZI9_9RHOB|nr:MFS transporter [Roseivivax lentus]SIT15955.1 Predicted arabinose efflux permease, MFS family [Roseivivax lentus]
MPPIIVILAIWAAGLGASAQYAKLAVGFDALAAIYTDAGAALGFAVSLLSLLGLVFGLSGGRLVGRIGPKRALVGGLVLGAAMSAIQALLPPLPVFLLARTVEGLSHLALVVAAPTLIAETAPPRLRPAAMTLWSTFFSVAFAALAWFGPHLIAARGLGGLLWAHAGYALLIALVLMAILPKPERMTPLPPAPRRSALRQHLALYGDPFVSAAGWGWTFYTFTFVSVLTLLPRLSPDPPAWLPALLPLAAIAASLSLGVGLLSRFSAVRISVTGFALSALATLAILGSGGAAWAVIVLFLCLGLVQAAGFAAVPELVSDPRDRAMANGAIAQTGNLGNLTGTPVLLALLSVGGTTPAILALTACYLAGGAAHVIMARRRALRRQEASASRAT